MNEQDHAPNISPSEAQPHRSVGTFLDDVTTTTMVKTALLAREGLGALHINVDTINGVVHLRGHVRTAEERALAEEIAEVYEGAVVVNELEVRPG